MLKCDIPLPDGVIQIESHNGYSFDLHDFTIPCREGPNGTCCLDCSRQYSATIYYVKLESREGKSGWAYNIFRSSQSYGFGKCKYSELLPTPEQAIVAAFGEIAIDKDTWIYHHAAVRNNQNVACV